MNRTDEYMKYINIPNQEPLTSNKVLFYDDIYYDIQKLNKSITPTLSYKNILILEKSISKISENVQQTLSVISIEGTRDEVVHFEGVKKIIQSLILSTRLRLEKLKIKKGSLSMDLEPERPKSYKVSPEIHHMEQETMEIMGNSVVERYRVTKQRLLEIESIQENISEQLNIQDERIDDVISKVGDIYESVRSSKDTVEKVTEAGSFFRRFFIILMFCLTFIIFFLHLYYKK
jgi:syntaxin 18